MLPTVYEGNEKYIFVSYAHKDSATVLPIVERLVGQGFRVWYDEGIALGSEWPESVATHLANAEVVLLFLSPAALASYNCKKEIHYAIHKRKEILAIHLEETAMTPGLEMQLGDIQAIYKHGKEDGIFYQRLLGASVLSACRASRPSLKPSPSIQSRAYSIGLSFRENGDGTATVTGIGTCEDEVVIIPPRSPNGSTVRSIGQKAFSGCRHMKEVRVPEGLVRMEGFAFSYCKKLSRLFLPSSLSDIGEGFLRGSNRLREITVHQNACYESREGALIRLSDHTLLKTVCNGKIPNGVRALAPFSVVYDEWSCHAPIVLPESVEHIMPRAFSESSFLTIDTGKNRHFFFAGGCLTEIASKRLILGLHSSSLPSDTKIIGEYAFSQENGISSFNVPEGVECIEKGAFFDLYTLEHIRLPNTLTQIGAYAFANCVSLRLISLPKSIAYIGKNAFLGCTSLEAVFMKDKNNWHLDGVPFSVPAEKSLAQQMKNRCGVFRKKK